MRYLLASQISTVPELDFVHSAVSTTAPTQGATTEFGSFRLLPVNTDMQKVSGVGMLSGRAEFLSALESKCGCEAVSSGQTPPLRLRPAKSLPGSAQGAPIVAGPIRFVESRAEPAEGRAAALRQAQGPQVQESTDKDTLPCGFSC